ncbi:MAG: DUF4126 domain-containing protein [Ignavibacteria bacterium]|nr:DUF4126 domain-containing protein [Ignavibacteria bacterium]
MEAIISVLIGIGLSAASGFRVFIPLLGLSIASMTGTLELGSDFMWVGSLPALIAFSAATLFEIGAYYIPWVDNALDTIASPLAVISGILVSASVLTDMSPFLKWTLAIIAGGGIAGLVQHGTVAVRATSSVTTGGFGNFILATFEFFGASLTTLLAIIVPVICIICLIILAIIFIRKYKKRKAIINTTS